MSLECRGEVWTGDTHVGTVSISLVFKAMGPVKMKMKIDERTKVSEPSKGQTPGR